MTQNVPEIPVHIGAGEIKPKLTHVGGRSYFTSQDNLPL